MACILDTGHAIAAAGNAHPPGTLTRLAAQQPALRLLEACVDASSLADQGESTQRWCRVWTRAWHEALSKTPLAYTIERE
jgi:hypothetical protein